MSVREKIERRVSRGNGYDDDLMELLESNAYNELKESNDCVLTRIKCDYSIAPLFFISFIFVSVSSFY